MTLAGRPFYDPRSDPAGGTAAWTLDDLCDFAAAIVDPYGGRLAGGPVLRSTQLLHAWEVEPAP